MEVEAIGTSRLLLRTSFYLYLNETFVVLLFRRNLISISALDKFGYCYSFGNEKFSLFHNSNLVGTGSLSGYDNLYLLDAITYFNESLHVNIIGVKCKLTGKNFTSL